MDSLKSIEKSKNYRIPSKLFRLLKYEYIFNYVNFNSVTLKSLIDYQKISTQTVKTFHSLNILTSMNGFYCELMFKGVSEKSNDGDIIEGQYEEIQFHETKIKEENCYVCFKVMTNNKTPM